MLHEDLLHLTSSIQIGSLDDTPSHKLLLTNTSRDSLLVYDSKPSVMRLYNSRSFAKTKDAQIGTRQISALEPCVVDDLGDLITASPAGIQTWRHAFDSRCTGPLRHTRHIRTSSLPTCLCTVQSRLFAGSASGVIAAYSLGSRQQLVRQYDGHRGRLRHLVAAGAGTVVSAADDDTVRIWDVDQFAQVGIITDQGRIRSLAYSPRFRSLACGGDDRVLSFWASDAGSVKAIADAHPAPIISCRFNERTPYLTSLDQDGILKIWDCRKFAAVQSMFTSISSGSISILCNRVVVAGSSATAPVYSMSDTREQFNRPERRSKPDVFNADVAVAGACLFCSKSDRIVQVVGRCVVIWSAFDGHFVARSPYLCAGNITAACLRTLYAMFVGDEYGYVYRIDYQNGCLIDRLPARHDNVPVRSMHFVLARDVLYTLSITRRSLCILEHSFNSRYQVRKMRFALLSPIVTFTSATTDEQVRAVIMTRCGQGALIDSDTGRSDFTLSGAHRGNAIVAVQILNDLRLFASTDVFGVICLWSWADRIEPVLTMESLTGNRSVKTLCNAPAVVMTYSEKTATIYVALCAQGAIESVHLQVGDHLAYRRLGRITVRNAPIQQISVIDTSNSDVAIMSLSQHNVDFYSTRAEFLGSLFSTGPGAFPWKLQTFGDVVRPQPIVPEPESKGSTKRDSPSRRRPGLRLSIAPSFSTNRLRLGYGMASVPEGVSLPAITSAEPNPQVQHVRQLLDLSSNAVKCTKLSSAEVNRIQRPHRRIPMRTSASEPSLSHSLRRAGGFSPLLTVSKKTSAYGVSSLSDCLSRHTEQLVTSQPVRNSLSGKRIALRIKIDMPNDPFIIGNM